MTLEVRTSAFPKHLEPELLDKRMAATVRAFNFGAWGLLY